MEIARDSDDDQFSLDQEETISDNNSESNMTDVSYNEENLRILEQYRDIVKLYRELPRDMCVNEISRMYAYSEADLEMVRENYFMHLKETCTDFPFGDDAILKRRVFTRSGDPLHVRLANDIYSIVEVTEGGDPTLLKSMISISKTRKQSVAQSARDRQSKNEASKITCSCSSDIELLKDQVSSLQAGLLLSKQLFHVNEKLQSEHVACSKRALHEIRSNIDTCNDKMNDYIKETVSTVRNVVTSAMARIFELEDRIRLLEAFIDSNNLMSVNIVESSSTSGQNEAESKCDHPCESGSSNQCAREQNDTICDYSQSTEVEQTMSENVICENIPPTKIVHKNTDIHTNNDRVNRNYSNSISVRITPRDNGNQSDFEIYRRKRPRRFCLLGLSRYVNIDVLSSVVSKKGPTVTNMAVFPTRKNPNKVMIRLNVRDDEYADMLLQNDFWPSYVTCKLWKSRSSLHRDIPPRMRSAVDNMHYVDTRSNFTDSEYVYGSRFNLLSTDVD